MLLVSPSNPYLKTRTQESPLLFGDKFSGTEGDFYLVHAADHIAKGFYHDKETGLVCKVKFKEEMVFKQFEFDNIFNGFSDTMCRDDKFILLAKEMPEQEAITMSRLVSTIAIAANFHGYTYDSRYCFSDTTYLPSICHALFWFIQFKYSNSLPIGNCAYRGHLGSDPIMSAEATSNYYERLNEYSKTPKIDGLFLHDYCKFVTDRILSESKAILSDKINALQSPK